MTTSDDSTPLVNDSAREASDLMRALMLSVLGGVAQFERDLIKERQREGIALAKQRGAYTGRKKRFPRTESRSCASAPRPARRSPRLARQFGISRETLYQYLRDEGMQ
jgi:DNA invertase Pin-like site-specific DNA recombinase